MSPQLSKLLSLLKSLEESIVEFERDPLVDEASKVAEDVLITETGANNWDAHEVLKQHGFEVFPGERDTFGWLIGCIQTKKGILCYG